MLSDEEKKAIKLLEEYLYFGNKEGVMCKNLRTINTVIEKQQKEIEELKEKFSEEKIRNTVIKRYREVIEKDYVSKDKIKAKIEEIDKVLNENIYVIDGHYDDRYYRYLQDKHILESLLEKE